MNKTSHSPFAFEPRPLKHKIRQRKQAVQERSQATIETIIDATLQVLLRDGYQKLTTTRVAERAGVSVGSIYQYFPDKSSMVMALKVRYVEIMLSDIKKTMSIAMELPLEGAARCIVQSTMALKRKKLPLILALRAPLADVGGEQFMRDATTQLIHAVRGLIEKHSPSPKDATLAARVLVSSVEGALSMAVYQSPELLQSEAFENELTSLLIGYLQAR